MLNNLIYKKLEQMGGLLGELRQVLDIPYSEFKSKFMNIRTAERNFQLIIELASDINAQIVSDILKQTPDTYRESFKKMVEIKVLDDKSLDQYIKSSTLRNILIHEYDFDEDNFIFYNSAKGFIPLYEEYIKSIHTHLSIKK
jgi:uncharacterized protein YutE (UPF0331/DUF86 family)